MKKIILLLGILLLVQGIAATTVELEADKDELKVNETIGFHLEVYPDKPIGGTLTVYREIEPNKFELVKTIYSKMAYSQCPTCPKKGALTDDLVRDFYFFPKDGGSYYAEANFGGVRDRANFTVLGNETTTTTSSTSSTTTTSTTSTSTSTSTTTSTTLPTTTLPTTTSTIPARKTIIDSIIDFLSGLVRGLI